MHTRCTELYGWCDPRGKNQVATRAMGDAHPGRTETSHFVIIGLHTMCKPDTVVEPANFLQVLGWSATELLQRVGVILVILGEVCVQANIESFCQVRRVDHQLLGHTEWRAWRQRHPNHGAVRSIVMLPYRTLAGSENFVVILHHIVGRKSAILLRE